jgi:hypothetical protein
MQPPRLLEQIAPDLPLAVGDAGVATAFAARTGCLRMPGPGDPAVAAGLATVALELHEQMPTDCTDVFVAAELAGALQAGFAAAGRTCSVHAVGAGKSMARFQRDFQLLHGLHLEERDFEVLAAAAGSERGPVVAVIGG